MTGTEAQIAALADGYFYHSIDLPGLPTIAGDLALLGDRWNEEESDCGRA